MSYYGRRGEEVSPVQFVIGGLILAAILAAFLWLVASPIIHPFVMMLWVHWPGAVMLGLAVLGAVLAGVYNRPGIGIPLVVIFGLLWVIGVIFGNAFWKYQAYLEDTPISYIQQEPDTTGFRFMPMEVAQTTATNKTNDSQVNPVDPEPFIDGNQAKWLAPLQPNNFSTTYFGEQPGYLLINTVADTERDTTAFTPGFGLCCFDGRSMGWSSVKQKFWADISPDHYMTILEGEPVIVQPYLTYKLRWHLVWPMMIPEYGGVIIFRSDETTEVLTAEEAAATYPESRLFPFEMADYFAKAYQLKDGAWNYMFTKRNVPDLPKLENMENKFPFLIPTEFGPTWYTAVEPYGESRSIFMSYYVSAVDGSVSVYQYDINEALVGPDRAPQIVNNAFNMLRNTYFYEPRPLVKDGKLYWMLSAAASGTPDVQFTALVDAKTEDVVRLENIQAVERVVNGEDPHRVGQVVSASASEDQPEQEASTQSSDQTMSDEELIKLLREAADRLETKGKQ